MDAAGGTRGEAGAAPRHRDVDGGWDRVDAVASKRGLKAERGRWGTLDDLDQIPVDGRRIYPPVDATVEPDDLPAVPRAGRRRIGPSRSCPAQSRWPRSATASVRRLRPNGSAEVFGPGVNCSPGEGSSQGDRRGGRAGSLPPERGRCRPSQPSQLLTFLRSRRTCAHETHKSCA
jgi:hypothetical protein